VRASVSRRNAECTGEIGPIGVDESGCRTWCEGTSALSRADYRAANRAPHRASHRAAHLL